MRHLGHRQSMAAAGANISSRIRSISVFREEEEEEVEEEEEKEAEEVTVGVPDGVDKQ